jgi:NTP pyrophosphatase (non-canonical NTP hydrolase)
MKDIQKSVKEFVEKHNLNASPEFRIVCMTEDLGELAKEILKSTGYGRHDFQVTGGFHEETGDVLFALVCIANAGGTDLEKSLQNTMAKMISRIKEKGHPGSRE